MVSIVQRSVDETVASTLAASGVYPALARVLAARGITSPAQLESSLSGLIPPERLTYNDKMAKLLADAIADNKKLLVIGDFLRSTNN